MAVGMCSFLPKDMVQFLGTPVEAIQRKFGDKLNKLHGAMHKHARKSIVRDVETAC